MNKDNNIPFLFKDKKPDWWGERMNFGRINRVPQISREVKEKFLKEVLLTHDDIQESVENDLIFQHDSVFKLQLRGFIEWLESPCTEHNTNTTHGQCKICKHIAWESLK